MGIICSAKKHTDVKKSPSPSKFVVPSTADYNKDPATFVRSLCASVRAYRGSGVPVLMAARGKDLLSLKLIIHYFPQHLTDNYDEIIAAVEKREGKDEPLPMLKITREQYYEDSRKNNRMLRGGFDPNKQEDFCFLKKMMQRYRYWRGGTWASEAIFHSSPWLLKAVLKIDSSLAWAITLNGTYPKDRIPRANCGHKEFKQMLGSKPKKSKYASPSEEILTSYRL